MKLLTSVLSTLLLTTFAFSNAKNLIKRNVFTIDLESISKNDQCKTDLMKDYNDCLVLFNYKSYSDNFGDVCNIVYSEKCQEFYEDPLSFLPSCKSSIDMVKVFDTSVINIFLSIINSGCETDEEGNLCPIAKSLFLSNKPENTNTNTNTKANTNFNSNSNDNINTNEELTYGKLFVETCKSIKCTNALIDIFKGELEYAKEVEELSFINHLDNNTIAIMKDFIKELKSENCDFNADNIDVRPVKTVEIKTNDVSHTLKMTNTIFIINLVLVLLHFFF